uniref:Uncharacterized protein n=1 Tax=Salix viminalis TaxID=40686 RepID=A0A6N2KV70_SALVM
MSDGGIMVLDGITLRLTALTMTPVSEVQNSVEKKLQGSSVTTSLPSLMSSKVNIDLDNPLVVSILDGNTLRMFLEDEDDFAMIARIYLLI